MREFAEMDRQQDTVKKKNKNKDDSNTLSRVGIPSMRRGRPKKDSAILSQTAAAAKLVKI